MTTTFKPISNHAGNVAYEKAKKAEAEAELASWDKRYQHAVDYFIVDFTVASESLVSLLADPTESKLTVDASGRDVRGCWVLNRPSTPPTLLWCCGSSRSTWSVEGLC